MNRKKVVIVGGGISGLISGIFAQIKGYNSKVYEMNDEIGGLYLKNSLNKRNLNDTYMYYSEELMPIYNLIGFYNIQIIETEYLIQYKDIKLYKNEMKLEEELIKNSLEDEKKIKTFIKTLINAKEMSLFYEKPFDSLSFLEPIKYKNVVKMNDKIYKKYHNVSIEKYFSDFESKEIVNLMYSIFPKKTSMYSLIFLLAMYLSNRLVRVKINSFEVMAKIKSKYIELGGIIETNKKAISIDVEKGKAMGVWFENNLYVNADYVICALDINYVFTNLLKNKYKDKVIEIKIKDFNAYPIYSMLEFEFSIKESENLPYVFSDDISRIKIGSTSVDKLRFINRGNGIISCPILQENEEYVYWSLYNKEPNAYKKEISRIFEEIKNELERILRDSFNVKASAKMLECTSPLDYAERFNCYRGGIFGFGLNSDGVIISHNGRIKEIKNIYLAGQWVSDYGGLLGAITSGYYSIVRLEYDNNKRTYQ